ncbi:unnamed protein product [Zymoseptoria tritici ST99CH_1A5]|uniref:C2H2-type domain-containing protein n=1 Tax=Zymoseptoria tritici ST99CH_1A5 TaxID=1276529 RepID=A0A1Y6LKT7_ZYMTR|nr:unnamed protein product [Zymoseptoria tritici ST99CH_1A5]
MADAMSLDIDSSDLELVQEEEWDNPYKPSAKSGEQMAKRFQDNQAEDRPLSKKAARSVTFQYGSPSNMTQQRRTEVVWDAFCGTVKHDISKGPDGETLLRFLDTIARRTVPSIRGKTIPSFSTIRNVHTVLIQLLTFRHEGWKLSSTWRLRIKAHLDDLVRRKLLHRGLWIKKQWVSYRLILRMANAWLRKAFLRGCINWDRHLHCLLYVLLLAATGMRPGDLTRSGGYKGVEWLPWEDLELDLRPDRLDLAAVEDLTVQDLRLKITLKYCKGKKSDNGADVVKYVDPMDSAENNSTCLVKLLVVTALRHGRVSSTTIEDLLAQAAQRTDGKVIWKYPKQPVLFAMGGSGKPLRYDAPVDLAVMRSALRAIATNAGVVDAHTIQLYDIRRGMIRAGAHVADSVKGIAGRAAASIAGHSVQALNDGLTAMYAGHVQTAVYNKIAADALPDRLAPRTDPSVFSVRTTVMPSQIASYKQKHPGVSTDDARRAIVLAITSDPNRAWASDANSPNLLHQPLPSVSTPSVPRRAPPSHPRRRTAILPTPDSLPPGRSAAALTATPSPHPQRPFDHASAVGAYPPPPTVALHSAEALDDETPGPYFVRGAGPKRQRLNTDENMKQSDLFSPAPPPVDATQALPHSPSSPPASDLLPELDPQLDDAGLEMLVGTIVQTSADEDTSLAKADDASGDENDDEDDDTLFGLALGETVDDPSDEQNPAGQDPLLLVGNAFVTKLATINTYLDQGNEGAQRTDPPATGNSRDPPTQYFFTCPVCDRVSNSFLKWVRHSMNCTVQERNAKTVPCQYKGCDALFTSPLREIYHRTSIHEWEPVPCTACPPDQQHVLYDTRHKLDYHQEIGHPEQELSCPIESRCHKGPFASLSLLRGHLNKDHWIPLQSQQMDDLAALPPYVDYHCPLPQCDGKEPYADAQSLRRHLAGWEHELDQGAIEALRPRKEFKNPRAKHEVYCPEPKCIDTEPFLDKTKLRQHLTGPQHKLSQDIVDGMLGVAKPRPKAPPLSDLHCPQPECVGKEAFDDKAKLRNHLSGEAHHLPHAKINSLIGAAVPRKKPAFDLHCPLPTCAGKKAWPAKSKLRRHLESSEHFLTPEDVDKMLGVAATKKRRKKPQGKGQGSTTGTGTIAGTDDNDADDDGSDVDE